MKNLAPILLFVYNRPVHTKSTLTALRENHLSKDSLLYIYSDGPKSTASEQELDAIKEVREIIRSEQWCGEVYIQEGPENLGLAQSIIGGVTEVIEKHGKAIILEDDILTNRYFIQFMNDALEIYHDNEIVSGISGYSYCENDNLPEPYLLPIGSSWGWGTWKRQWSTTEWDAEKLYGQIKHLARSMDFGNIPFEEMLNKQKNGEIDSWAIRFYASMFLNDQYFFYPRKALIKNIGFDDQGTHTKGSNSFYERNVEDATAPVKIAELETPDNEIVKFVDQHCRKSLSQPEALTQKLKKKALAFINRAISK